jgi:hypothetical protein
MIPPKHIAIGIREYNQPNVDYDKNKLMQKKCKGSTKLYNKPAQN